MKTISTVRLWVLASVILLAASILSFPGKLGFTKFVPLTDIQQEGGYLFSATFPQGTLKFGKRAYIFPDPAVLLEDGQPLKRPMSSESKILNAGRGRYVFQSGKILFSTSDTKDIGVRNYTLQAPRWVVPEWLLIGFWLGGGIAALIAFWRSVPEGFASLQTNAWGRWTVQGLTVVFLIGVCVGASWMADEMFLGLCLPVVWAVLMGMNAAQPGKWEKLSFVLLALVPAFAGYVYYTVNAASDGYFMVGGMLPWSDAKSHFIQAAEIALQGSTDHLFNGRLLYPAFLAVFLQITGLNLPVASFLVGCFVMLALAATCLPIAKRLGLVGTASYCLLFWLYFRVNTCGLVMTEHLGLLLGLLGLWFLFYSVDRQKIAFVFLSLLFFGLASVARPGALFILPALSLYAGIRVWKSTFEQRRFRIGMAVAAVCLGGIITAGCFAANHVSLKMLTRGEGKPFGNFAFTLHGLLNNTDWSTSNSATSSNATLVMQQNIEQLKESPSSLFQGIARAYVVTWKSEFLFRFGVERRLSAIAMFLFLVALFTCWFWSPIRQDAWWILLLAAGILVSIPFAPPWDAGLRPYAATIPVQVFFPSLGVVVLLDWLKKGAQWVGILSMRHTDEPRFKERVAGLLAKKGDYEGKIIIGFSALCFLLVLPVPLLLSTFGNHATLPNLPFLPSSSRLIAKAGETPPGYLSREKFLDRLSDFQADSPESGKRFMEESENCVIAINWRDFWQPLIKPHPPSEVKK